MNRKNGRYSVGTIEGYYSNKWGTNNVTVYYPAGVSDGSAPQDIAKPPYPAVIFAHGFGANKDFYRWIGNQLASWGYIAGLFSVPGPISTGLNQWSDGISDCVTYLDELSTSKTSVLGGMVDSTRIGVMGHSMGGAGAILATGRDSRIKATVALAPGHSRLGSFVFAKALEAAKSIRVPVQIQVGSADRITPKKLVHEYYMNIPRVAAKEYVEIKGGSHIQFIDSLNILLPMFDLGGTLGLDRQHQISRMFFTAWFQYFLCGQDRFETYIFGARAWTAKATGELSALEWAKP
mgnify:CR=1 FL=1